MVDLLGVSGVGRVNLHEKYDHPGLGLLAAFAQGFELALQRPQLRNALGHTADVLIQHGIDFAAVVFRRVTQA
jgi:hypothetical protein